MNLRFVLLLAVWVAYLAASASGFSLLAAGAASKLGFVKGAVLGAGLAGLSQPASETIIINAESSNPVEVSSPVQVVSYQPIQSIAVPQPLGIFGSVWNVIHNAIISKTRAVSSLLNAFTPSPQQQIVIVVNNTETTTTTEKPSRVYEIVRVAEPQQEEVVPVLINRAPCLTCYY